MENFSFRQIKNKIQTIVKEYMAEEFLKSLETSEDYIPDLEYAQTISDSVIDLSEETPLRVFYQARTRDIEAVEFLFATYHKVLKNVTLKIQVHHTLKQTLLFEETFTLTIEDNSRIKFPLTKAEISKNTPLTISIILIEKGTQRLSLWYGRNVNIYGGSFRIGKNRISGYPALRIFTKSSPHNIPSLSLSNENMEFLKNIQDITDNTEKEQKEIIAEYESLFQSILTENKGLEEQVELLQQEKETLLKHLQLDSNKYDSYKGEKSALLQNKDSYNRELIQRIASQHRNSFQIWWKNPIYRRFFLMKYRWFIRRKKAEFAVTDLTSGIELEQSFSLTCAAGEIYLFWGTHERKNIGIVQVSLLDEKNNLLKHEEIPMQSIPNLSALPFSYDFTPAKEYHLNLTSPDGIPGNCISPIGIRNRTANLPAIRFNGYRIPAVLKIQFPNEF